MLSLLTLLMGERYRCRLLGFHVCYTLPDQSEITGASLLKEKVSIGTTWTRTSVSKDCCRADSPAKALTRLKSG